MYIEYIVPVEVLVHYQDMVVVLRLYVSRIENQPYLKIQLEPLFH